MDMKIELNIEELVLHGLNPADRYHIAESMQRELAQLIAVQGLPSSFDQSTRIDQINAGSIELGPSSKAEAIGVNIARSMYGGLKR